MMSFGAAQEASREMEVQSVSSEDEGSYQEIPITHHVKEGCEKAESGIFSSRNSELLHELMHEHSSTHEAAIWKTFQANAAEMEVKGTMKRWLQLADQKSRLQEADTLCYSNQLIQPVSRPDGGPAPRSDHNTSLTVSGDHVN